MITSSLEQILEKFFPSYLNKDEKFKILHELSQKPFSNFYSTNQFNYLCQGDCIYGLELYDFDSNQIKRCTGIILSNTCDISEENKRILPIKITFATAITFSTYKKILTDYGINQNTIESHLNSIKNQESTNRFYLPSTESTKDLVVFLDDIHTIKMDRYKEIDNKKTALHLSNSGFYLFLLKLSIHFCRMYEKINRG